jgi:uncharacterized lipoprotein YehR (DUF1307 family)
MHLKKPIKHLIFSLIFILIIGCDSPWNNKNLSIILETEDGTFYSSKVGLCGYENNLFLTFEDDKINDTSSNYFHKIKSVKLINKNDTILLSSYDVEQKIKTHSTMSYVTYGEEKNWLHAYNRNGDQFFELILWDPENNQIIRLLKDHLEDCEFNN